MRSDRTPWGAHLALLLIGIVAGGCEKPSHENIDKWRSTMKGPGKLASALGDSGLDADLRAHAAQALISIEKTEEVTKAIAQMNEAERAAVLEKVVPRLWSDCKLGELQPTTKQLLAKDAMFTLRAQASPKVQDEIDGYLLDWLSSHYEDLSERGQHAGEKIIRTMGAKAAPKLIAAAKATLADPGDKTSVAVLGDKLLAGIAYTGSPDAVGFLLDLASKPQGIDERLEPGARLQVRAMGALYQAYVTDNEPPLADRRALKPHVGKLQAIAVSEEQPGENVNVSFELIAAAGKPECIAPMTALAQSKDAPRRWRAVQFGLKCAGAEGVVAMAEALPQGIGYEEGIIEKYFWDKIVELGPGAAAPARTLLGSQSWVARLTGVRVLAKVGAAADATALKQMAKDGAKAQGWWGTDPQTKKKPEPTLGALAMEAANKLENKR